MHLALNWPRQVSSSPAHSMSNIWGRFIGRLANLKVLGALSGALLFCPQINKDMSIPNVDYSQRLRRPGNSEPQLCPLGGSRLHFSSKVRLQVLEGCVTSLASYMPACKCNANDAAFSFCNVTFLETFQRGSSTSPSGRPRKYWYFS